MTARVTAGSWGKSETRFRRLFSVTSVPLGRLQKSLVHQIQRDLWNPPVDLRRAARAREFQEVWEQADQGFLAGLVFPEEDGAALVG